MSTGSVGSRQPDDTGDFRLDFIPWDFEAGRSVQAIYAARCCENGERESVAVASSTNLEPAEDADTVFCPQALAMGTI